MYLECVIYNGAYTTVQGDGAVYPLEAQFERKLDGMGGASLTFRGTDSRVISYMVVGNVLELWAYPDVGEDWTAREIGAYVVVDVAKQIKAGQMIWNVTCNDLLMDFKEDITLPNQVYDDVVVNTLLSTIVTSKSGWSYSGSGLGSLMFSGRYQGASLLKVMEDAVKAHGVHFRLSTSASKTVQAGAFGSSSGIVLEYIEGDADIRMDEDSPMLLADLEILSQSADVVNWILAFGAGDGDAALSLVDSDRAGVSTATANSRDYGYIDLTGVSSYGRTVKARWDFKHIGQVGASAAQRLAAANLLYDAAYARGLKFKDPYVSYLAEVRNVTQAINVGDKVRLVANGQVVRRADSGYTVTEWINVNQEVWVMRSSERWNRDGVTAQLTLATIDRNEASIASEIVSIRQDIIQQNEHMQSNTGEILDRQARIVSNDVDGAYAITLRNGCYKVVYAELVLRRYAVVEHNHQWGQVQDETAVGPQAFAPRIGVALTDGGLKKLMMMTNAPVAAVWLTAASTDAYGAALATKPEDCDVTVNGTSVATGLFVGAGDEETVDITSAMNGRVGGVIGEHPIVIECTGANTFGWIECEIYVEFERSAVWGSI